MGAEKTLVTVELVGWREVNRLLSQMDTALRDELVGGLESVMREAAAEAAGRIHSVSGASKRGYRVSRSAKGIALRNAAKGASVVEFANNPKCPQGEHLVATLNARYGSPGRLAWAAVDRRRARIEAEAQRTADAITQRFEGRL